MRSPTLPRSTLRSRIEDNHLEGRVGRSTLRKTLGAILFVDLGLSKIGPEQLSTGSEHQLSAWMRTHHSVGVNPLAERGSIGALEEDVVCRLDPPLNLQHCEPSPLRETLKKLRS